MRRTLHPETEEPLRAIVTAKIVRHASTDEQVTQTFQDIFAGQPAGHVDRQALPGVLVDERQHPKCTTVVGAVMPEVIAPHMISADRSQPYARRIV